MLLQEAENTLPDEATREAALALAQAVEGLPLALGDRRGVGARRRQSLCRGDIRQLRNTGERAARRWREPIATVSRRSVKLSYEKLSEDAQLAWQMSAPGSRRTGWRRGCSSMRRGAIGGAMSTRSYPGPVVAVSEPTWRV